MIVDTFAVLREENEFREYDLENICLICGINRSTLDKRTDPNASTSLISTENQFKTHT